MSRSQRLDEGSLSREAETVETGKPLRVVRTRRLLYRFPVKR